MIQHRAVSIPHCPPRNRILWRHDARSARPLAHSRQRGPV